MAYSVDTKNEIANSEVSSSLGMKMEISAFMRTNAIVSLGFRDEISMRFESEFSSTVRRIYKIIKALYGYEAEIHVSKNDQLRKASFYKLMIEDEDVSRYLLEDSGFEVEGFSLKEAKGFNSLENYSTAQLKAFLKGAFLGGGYITDPNKGYLLEIVLNNKENLDFLMAICKSFGIKALSRNRKDKYIFYLKNSEDISDFLSLIDGTNAMLGLENVKVLKDVKNNVQRMVNCETANIDKVVNAAMKQVDAIEKIQNQKGINFLPMGLREIASLRLEFPDDSLKDLGERLNPPLGKSGVNHRMKKIMKIAEEL